METRVSRYAKLREEIEKMDDDESSSKSKTSKVVNEVLKEGDQSPQRNVPIDKTLQSYEFYKEDKEEVKEEKKELSVGSKKIIIYALIASGIVLILAATLIIIGINIF